MVPGGITEMLWYFVGYLRLYDDDGRPRDIYQGAPHPSHPEDFSAKLKESQSSPDFLDEETKPTKPLKPDLTDPTPFPGVARVKPVLPEEPLNPHIGSLSARPVGTHEPGGGGGGGKGGGGGGNKHAHLKQAKDITVSYEEGGADQALVQIDQHNHAADDDLLLVNDATPNLHGIDIAAVLNGMAEEANAQKPADLVLPTDTMSLAEFVATRDATIAEQGGPDHEPVAPGRYVNGELQPEGPSESPTPDPADTPERTTFPPGEWASLGANELTNAAVIVDTNEAVRTMIVLGDYHNTDVIVQTNVLVDSDLVKVAGGAEATDGAIVTDGNQVDNIAEFVENDGIYSAGTGRFAGFYWNVDVVHGDFYDIKYVVQTNNLYDNDVIVQETQDSHYSVIAGENEQVNYADITDLGQYYDVIIIGGNAYAANFIYQTNLVLDNDIVKMLALGGEANPDGAATGQQAITGQNELLNDATITTYGADEAMPITSDMNNLVSALTSGSTELDPNTYGWTVPGNGSGVLNVLYIDGDYYDINAIWQLNVIADVDTGIQLLSGDAAAAEDSVQSANAGSNLITNAAAIIDAGATNLFVGGEAYEDAILVQADIVTENDKIQYGDVESLVPEVIAFTDAPGSDTDWEPITPTQVDTTSADLMGHVMT